MMRIKPTGSAVWAGDLKSARPHSFHREASCPDIFARSNTIGSAAEKLGRCWIAFERDRAYLAASAFRFIDELPAQELAPLWTKLHSDGLPVVVISSNLK
jgi:hypothetical protein